MREFAKFEYAKAKCIVCGCRNKVFSPLYDTDQSNRCKCLCGEMEDYKVGYRLRCCNCGGEKYFINDHLRNGKPIRERSQLVIGEEICYQPSYCKHKECPLYGTCTDFYSMYTPSSTAFAPETDRQKTYDSLDSQNTYTVELVPEESKFL